MSERVLAASRKDDSFIRGTPLREFGDGGGVDAGVLADVEGLEVEAVGADFEEEGIDEEVGEAVAAVVDEAVAEDGEVAEEIGGAGVGRRARGWAGAGRWIGAWQPRRIMMQERSRRERLVGEAIFEGVLAGGAELGEVGAEERFELGGDGDLLGGAAELLEDVLQAAAVVAEEQGVGHGEGVAGGLRGDEGVAVAVATDPGAEADELGEGGRDRGRRRTRLRGRWRLRSRGRGGCRRGWTRSSRVPCGSRRGRWGGRCGRRRSARGR